MDDSVDLEQEAVTLESIYAAVKSKFNGESQHDINESQSN